MSKPQRSVGGRLVNIYYFSGKNSAAKTRVMSELQNILYQKSARQKLVYLPLADKQTHTELELASARVLMADYAHKGNSVITNVLPLEAGHYQVIELKTNRLNLAEIEASLKSSQGSKHTPKNTASVLSALGSGVAFNIRLDDRAPVESIVQKEPTYGEYFRSILDLHAKIWTALDKALLDPSIADNVLPLGLAISTPPNTTLEHEPVQSMDSHQQHLQVNTSYDPYTKLISASPRNELDIVSSILYHIGDISLDAAQEDADAMSFDDKIRVLQDYISQPGSKAALKGIIYNLDICQPASMLNRINSAASPSNSIGQLATPLLGYDVPPEIEQVGCTDLYQSAFDSSYTMHSLMHAQHGIEFAQYACLLGHRVRSSITTNYLSILSSKDKSLLKNTIGGQHPLITSML